MTLMNITNLLTIVGFLLISNGTKGIVAAEGLDKPVAKSRKTIKTEYGDVYDCVDFYEQPAFKHPLLRNHSFYPQMRPSSRPKWMASTTTKLGVEASYAHFKGGGCPSNTVPIRRMSKGDLSRVNLLSKKLFSSRMNSYSNAATMEPGTHRAIIQSKRNPGTTTYSGVGAWLTLWNPSPVQADQYSSGQFIIQDGLDSIQVGWTVNPTLYKDNETHMFIHTTTAGGLHCFNTYCTSPGFVLVRSDMPPDVKLGPTSVRGEEIKVSTFFVYQDQASGNWWLEVGQDSEPIGFWPQNIFTGLAHSGSYIACGGETYSPPGKPGGGPPMGTGDFLKTAASTFWDAACYQFVTVNEKHQIVDVEDTEEFLDTNRYEVIDDGFYLKELGHLALFGGPGGDG